MDSNNHYEHGAEFALELSTNPSPLTLRRLFQVRVEHWTYPIVHAECGTIGAFGDVKINPDAAFQLIGTAADILLSQTNDGLLVTAGWLLSQIIETSQTTEMPSELERNWSESWINLDL